LKKINLEEIDKEFPWNKEKSPIFLTNFLKSFAKEFFIAKNGI